MEQLDRETIVCPCCQGSSASPWAEENGYVAVKCSGCGLVFVNPRPANALIAEAVETGIHADVPHERTAIGRRDARKVDRYHRVLGTLFRDIWDAESPISWLDVGAGYGEVVEAVSSLVPGGSTVIGVEPMQPKARQARDRGLDVRQGYLSDVAERVGFLSLVNVFSHIPEFRGFLSEVRATLIPGGEVFIETGNIGDLASHRDAPSELDLPDHLVFAGENNIVRFLEEAGFAIVTITRTRRDGVTNFAKNIVKKALGRDVHFRMPYTSNYRTLLIRARMTRGDAR